MSGEARRRTLDQRMAWVQGRLEDVPRSGHAEVTMRSGGSYSYDYLLESDLMAGVRPLLAQAGIAFYYSDEILSYAEGAAHVRVTVTLAAAGDERRFTSDGYATDLGDKAANKAKTSALRYWLWKTFLQPNDEDDDPEQSNVTVADAARADEARRRAERLRRGDSTRRTEATNEGDSKGRLIQRISTLANELDEVQGLAAGRTLTDLIDAVRAEHGGPLAELEANDLVRIGRALADHVAAERSLAERDGLAYTATGFRLPRS